MTTIAYKGGVLAADSRCVSGGWTQRHEVEKLHRLADGTVAAVTGDLAVARALVDWLSTDRSMSRPNIGDDARVIHMGRDGQLTVYENAGSFPVDCEFTAFGSGAPPALGALMMGADVARAVEIAAAIDPNTGGRIVTMKCE